MKAGYMVLLGCVAAFGQQSTGAADTKGTCSPANTGNNNTFTINCGIGKEQGQELIKILNKILANQLDPNAVMTKLDEMHQDIRQIRDNQGWPDLTQAQMAIITNAAARFPGHKMTIWVPNPERDTQSLGGQLARALKAPPANWDGSVQTMMTFAPPDSPVPLGIEIRVKEETPAVNALINALVAVFGRAALSGVKDDKLAADMIQLQIFWKPRQ